MKRKVFKISVIVAACAIVALDAAYFIFAGIKIGGAASGAELFSGALAAFSAAVIALNCLFGVAAAALAYFKRN